MEKKKFLPLGISGVGFCGKDSLFKCLQNILQPYDIKVVRWALADLLKMEINNFTINKYGISAFTKDKKEKILIRDIMVSHGKIMRTLSQGTYWTGLLTNNIQESINNGELPIITDIRYMEYPNDEYQWLKNFGGYLIHIEKVLSDGSVLLPPNNEEKENDPKLKKVADYHLRWIETLDENIWMDCVNVQLKSLIDRIIS